MPRIDRHSRRNPYLQIARQVLVTHDRRIADIQAMRTDLKAIKSKTQALHIRRATDCLKGTDGRQALTLAQAALVLEQHIQELQHYVDIVEYAYERTLEDITDPDIYKRVKECLVRTYSEYKQIPYHLLGYPLELSYQDYEIRRRVCLKYVLRELGIMPYVEQPAFCGPYIRAVIVDIDLEGEKT